MAFRAEKKQKLRQLDKSRPFAELFGIIGATYEQDGIYFTSSGTEAPDAHEMPPEEEPEPDVDDADIKPATVLVSPEPPVQDGESFETMHSKHLQALVEGYGGTFTDRNDAVHYLRHRPVAA